MQSIKEFLIEIKNPFNDTFKTESGLELYADKKLSQDRLSNRIAKVVNVPIENNTPIKVGDQVLIDATILYRQIFHGVQQDYQTKVDDENMVFKLSVSGIILYRENEKTEWNGVGKNAFISYVEEKQEEQLESAFIHVPKKKKTYKRGYAKLVYGNAELSELGLKNNDDIVINPNGGVSFWLDGKEFWWIRNKDIFALIENAS